MDDARVVGSEKRLFFSILIYSDPLGFGCDAPTWFWQAGRWECWLSALVVPLGDVQVAKQ